MVLHTARNYKVAGEFQSIVINQLKTDLQFLPPGESVSLEKIGEKLRLQVTQVEDLIKQILLNDPSLGFLNVFRGIFVRSSTPENPQETFDYNEISQLDDQEQNLILHADTQFELQGDEDFLKLVSKMTTEDKEMIAQMADLVLSLKGQGSKIGNDAFFQRMGVVGLMNGQISESEIFFDEIWTTTGSLSKWVNIGINLMKGNLKDEAEEAFRVALQYSMSDGDAWFRLASILLEKRNYEEAEMAFEKAIAYMPNSGDIWGSLGELLLQLGRLDEAEEVFRSALLFDPNLSDVWKSLGSLLFARGSYDEAERVYKNAIDLHPKDMDFWIRIGDVYNQMDRYSEGEIAYQQSIHLDPMNYEVLFKLGMMHYKQKMYKDAYMVWKRTIDGTTEEWTYHNEVKRLIKNMQERLLI